jgi:hypothetical protein
MELEAWMFVGVSVALSVLGFFLKREARKSVENDTRIGQLEMMMAKNDVLDTERWKVANKLLEDRRNDVQKLFDMVSK